MNSTRALKSLRCKNLLTQQDVAKLLNVSRQTYNMWEQSILSIDIDTCLSILKVLNASETEIDEFFNALKQDYMSYKGE